MTQITNNHQLYFSKNINETLSNIFNYPLTIVEAPMGYGKTISLREYLKNTKALLLWQNIYDDSNLVFWQIFCRHIQKIDTNSAFGLNQLGFPDDSLSIDTAVNLISNISFTKPTVFVFDDMHLADMHKIAPFLKILVTNKVPNLHIILIARYFDYFHTQELSLKGYLYHIKKESFVFNEKEIINYYSSWGIPLTLSQAKELFTLTDGWISALYLFMLSYKESNQTLACLHCNQLIKQELYDPFPEKIKTFLLSMSIYNNFTINQAIYMMPDVDMEKMIDHVIRKNAFITYDPNHKTYQMCSIFKTFLYEQLQLKSPDFHNELYHKAAKWYLQNQEYLLSIENASIIGDFETMLEALELDRGQSINGEHKDKLIKYYTKCPMENKTKHPYALLIFARLMFIFNEIHLYKEACQIFFTIYNTLTSKDIHYKTRLLGEYELVLSYTKFNNIQEMCKHYKRSYELLKEPSSIIDQKTSWTYGSPSVLYLFYRQSGELKNEVKAMNNLMPYYHQITGNHGKGAAEIMAGEYFYYTGDFENAEIAMHTAYSLAETAEIIICTVYLNMKLAFMTGNFANILTLFQKLRNEMHEKKWYMSIHTIDICEAYIFSCLHITEKVQPWIKNGEFQNTRLFFPAKAYLNIVYCKFLLTNGEYLKLIALSKQFLEKASTLPNLLAQINTYIYLAGAYNKIKKPSKAIPLLKQALNIAMPDKMYMPFVESGYYIKTLLEELKQCNLHNQDIEKILQLYKQYQKVARIMIIEYSQPVKAKLTERENAVAHLASLGFSNKEIGTKLFVSENTVKTQMKSIFYKLGINSRALLKQKLEP